MQFWRTTCKYRRVIRQQYTRGIQKPAPDVNGHIILNFSMVFRDDAASSKLLLNAVPADVKMRVRFGWSWDLSASTLSKYWNVEHNLVNRRQTKQSTEICTNVTLMLAAYGFDDLWLRECFAFPFYPFLFHRSVLFDQALVYMYTFVCVSHFICSNYIIFADSNYYELRSRMAR